MSCSGLCEFALCGCVLRKHLVSILEIGDDNVVYFLCSCPFELERNAGRRLKLDRHTTVLANEVEVVETSDEVSGTADFVSLAAGIFA